MADSSTARSIEITRVKGNTRQTITDKIIDEKILEILVNNERAFQMVVLMTHLKALAAGFLFTQGIVRKKSDITAITVDKEKSACRITLNNPALERLQRFHQKEQIKGSSGGILIQEQETRQRAKPASPLTISHEQVLSLMEQHRQSSELFLETGAVHSAALCDCSGTLLYREDIGRHNALDKLAGEILLEEINTSDKVATLSCRISIEIIGKIITTGVPVVITNAAPTLSATRLADQADVTLIGFARGNRFNIYTHGRRVVPGPGAEQG
ncbi:MAG TPA: formate dehydrogenase accessory sulfurtransferase FdhD [Desulfobacteraceae bacterium]|nr:formate dehydrogenase accessory sulfurtransferase FdhD [Desulfobacteraceae bacterium]